MNNTSIQLEVTMDQPSVRSYFIGGMIMVLCLPGLIGNLLVGYIEIKKGLLVLNHSSMYKLSFNLIIADSMHLTLLAFYLAPTSMVQNWLLPDNWSRLVPGRLLLIAWYNMLLDLCLLALNRYIAVCRPQSYATVFSNSKTKVMIALSWIGAGAIVLIGELMPCCSLYLYYKVYSYAFFDQLVPNYNNMILLLPINSLTSILVIVVYALVIHNIRASNARVADKLAAESQQRRRVKEVRYAVQLTLVSAVFVSVWLLFNIFANLIPASEALRGYFSVVIVLEIINGSANSFVSIMFNKDINGTLKVMFGLAQTQPSSNLNNPNNQISVKQQVNVASAAGV